MPIFDQGYQHWQGTLGSHGWRWLAITRHGVRIGMQNRTIRSLVIIAWIPSLMLAGVISLWGLVEQKYGGAMSLLGSMFPVKEFLDNPAAFRVTMWTYCFYFFMQTEIWFVMIVMLLVGPGLISQDLRFNALPLYFSRPVRRIDYFIGKLGVIGAFLGMVIVVPAVAAWFLGVLFSLDFTVIFDTGRILIGMILYGLVVTVSAGLLILALSSLSRDSRYVGAACAGFWILTGIVYGILEGVHVSSYYRQQSQVQWEQERGWQAKQQEIQQRNNDLWQKEQAEEWKDNEEANQDQVRVMPPEERALERRRGMTECWSATDNGCCAIRPWRANQTGSSRTSGTISRRPSRMTGVRACRT